MTIFELAIEHIRSCGVSEPDALTIVEAFGSGNGKDIEWGGIAPELSRQQVARIDAAAVGWLHSHRLAVTGHGRTAGEPR